MVRKRGAAPGAAPGGVSDRERVWRALTLARHAVAELERVYDAMAPAGFSDRLIETPEVLALLNINRQSLRLWIKAGRFPAPLPRASTKSKQHWRWSDVEAYVTGKWMPRPKRRS